MSIKTAAREVVAFYAWGALVHRRLLATIPAPEGTLLSGKNVFVDALQPLVENLQRELNLDGDRTDLAADMHARRATDSAENMASFRAEFWRLAKAYRHASGQVDGGEFDALSMFVFGDAKLPPKLMLLDAANIAASKNGDAS